MLSLGKFEKSPGVHALDRTMGNPGIMLTRDSHKLAKMALADDEKGLMKKKTMPAKRGGASSSKKKKDGLWSLESGSKRFLGAGYDREKKRACTETRQQVDDVDTTTRRNTTTLTTQTTTTTTSAARNVSEDYVMPLHVARTRKEMVARKTFRPISHHQAAASPTNIIPTVAVAVTPLAAAPQQMMVLQKRVDALTTSLNEARQDNRNLKHRHVIEKNRLESALATEKNRNQDQIREALTTSLNEARQENRNLMHRQAIEKERLQSALTTAKIRSEDQEEVGESIKEILRVSLWIQKKTRYSITRLPVAPSMAMTPKQQEILLDHERKEIRKASKAPMQEEDEEEQEGPQESTDTAPMQEEEEQEGPQESTNNNQAWHIQFLEHQHKRAAINRREGAERRHQHESSSQEEEGDPPPAQTKQHTRDELSESYYSEEDGPASEPHGRCDNGDVRRDYRRVAVGDGVARRGGTSNTHIEEVPEPNFNRPGFPPHGDLVPRPPQTSFDHPGCPARSGIQRPQHIRFNPSHL
jgi:hypothetical protein